MRFAYYARLSGAQKAQYRRSDDVTTLPVPTGRSYTVVIAALNSAGLSIGDSAPLTNKTLAIANAALDLQTVTIPIQ